MNIHIQALQDLVERTNLAGLLALLGDSIWVVRDMCVNGITPTMLLIATVLLMATGIMLHATIKYHCKTCSKIVHKMRYSKILK